MPSWAYNGDTRAVNSVRFQTMSPLCGQRPEGHCRTRRGSGAAEEALTCGLLMGPLAGQWERGYPCIILLQTINLYSLLQGWASHLWEYSKKFIEMELKVKVMLLQKKNLEIHAQFFHNVQFFHELGNASCAVCWFRFSGGPWLMHHRGLTTLSSRLGPAAVFAPLGGSSSLRSCLRPGGGEQF